MVAGDQLWSCLLAKPGCAAKPITDFFHIFIWQYGRRNWLPQPASSQHDVAMSRLSGVGKLWKKAGGSVMVLWRVSHMPDVLPG